MVTYRELKKSEKRTLEEALLADPGYILDFSNRTIEEYFEDEFGLEFYDNKYSFNGESKAKRLRAILEVETAKTSQILRELWDYRSTLPEIYRATSLDEEESTRESFFSIVCKLEGDKKVASMDAFERFDSSETLGNLLYAIESDIRADRPSAALDRLHTYCQRKFRMLLESKGREVSSNDPLHSRVGMYAKILENEHQVSEMTLRIVKNSISIFESFNDVRNNQSLAHDNETMGTSEARFIFDSVGSVLRFLKSVETEAFGS